MDSRCKLIRICSKPCTSTIRIQVLSRNNDCHRALGDTNVMLMRLSQISFSEQVLVCLRDDTRTFVLAKTLQFDHYFPVAIGEASGLFHALQWMQDMHFDYIDFELDSKVTRDVFHSRHTDITEFESIITACREMFSTSFPNSRVEFIRRQADSAACSCKRSHFPS